MIKTLIVDDEQHSINAVESLLRDNENYIVCGFAKTVEKAVELTHALKPDLVFLDIILGRKTGFDYLNEFLPNFNFDVIFTTGYNEYAVKAFEYSALHYLMKPIEQNDFQDALSRMDAKISQQERLDKLSSLEYNFEQSNGYKFIHIATTDSYHKIHSKRILYVEADSNYTNFYLTSGKKITTSRTLKYYTNLLKGSHFFKVSKSFIVNIEQIKTFKRKSRELIMNDDSIITVAIRRQTEFIKTVFAN